MNAVLGSIIENLRHVEIVEVPTIPVFTNDRLSTGDTRELTVKEFLESYLTSDYIIKKGSIYSLDSFSKNIDCVVLSPTHPKLVTPIREVILAEGVFAAVEVKPDITVLTDKSEFFRGLLQAKSVKNLERKVVMFDERPDYFKKIPFVIFSLKSSNHISTIDFIRKKIEEGILSNQEIPDIIIALDKGIILYSPCLSATAFGPRAEKYYPKEKFGDAGFVLLDTQDKEYTLAMFLLLFLTLTPPRPHLNSHILTSYLTPILIHSPVGVRIYPVYNPNNYDAYLSDL